MYTVRYLIFLPLFIYFTIFFLFYIKYFKLKITGVFSFGKKRVLNGYEVCMIKKKNDKLQRNASALCGHWI